MGFLPNSIFFIIFPIIINQFVIHIPVVAAKNVLMGGDELNSLHPTSTLVSTNGIFTMGFFTITYTNFIYLGIWNTNDEQARKVWVANRDMPIITSGVLMIDDSGTLKVIIRGGGTGTGSNTNTVTFNVSNEVGSGNTRAVLEDSGNFILYDNAKQNQTLWQSFDHPTDILLPGMKIGYNLTTKQNWTVTSWLSAQNPASGAFTMSLEQIQNSPHLVIYQHGSVYWSSGPWKNGTFQELFGFPLSFPRKLNLVYDDSGMYFTFQTTESNISMLQLSSRGELIDGETNDMLTPSVYYCNNNGTCWSSLKSWRTPAWTWVVLAAILLISLLAAFWCYVRIRRCYVGIQMRRGEEQRRDYICQLAGSQSFNYGDELEKGIQDAPNIKIFSLKAILTATDNFSNENKLGQGGYGPVYKGKMLDGRYIAVKRLSKTSVQGFEEFKSELILISKLQHTNLVRLYGCCIHQEEKMLIYEFMPNKSLDLFLFDKKEQINWRMRFNIIEGVAQGLLYLHKYSRMKVIHRDLKVNNILLDKHLNPKIADFGMARIFQQNVIEEITNRVVGTRGYMAPEYIMRGTFSTKSDVYSFGVLIIEIISGKPNSSFYNIDEPLNLMGYAWKLWKEDAMLKLKDEILDESCDEKQLIKAIHVGLLCVQENAEDRPTMSEIICMFTNEITDLPQPKQPAFFTSKQTTEAEIKSKDYILDKNISPSVNGLTITMIKAR